MTKQIQNIEPCQENVLRFIGCGGLFPPVVLLTGFCFLEAGNGRKH
jgi:hypothetical protein